MNDTSAESRGLNILLTEDDPDVARYLATVLKTLGHQIVAIASTGVEAVDLALKLHPDLVIMDIDLPEMDGVTAAQRILEQTSMPIIISTGRTDSDALDMARQLNIQAYLVKPFNAVQLKPALAIAMAQHQFHHQAQQKITELARALSNAQGQSDAEIFAPERLVTLGLTRREAEVMHWMAQGKTNGDIAVILESSPRTVAKHVEHIFEKLSVECRTAAVAESRQLLQTRAETEAV